MYHLLIFSCCCSGSDSIFSLLHLIQGLDFGDGQHKEAASDIYHLIIKKWVGPIID